MFWWLYYTTADFDSNYENKPLVIWIQGGPGVSGAGFGNFEEIGPLNSKLQPRNHTWVSENQIFFFTAQIFVRKQFYFSQIKDYNVLFIDNPVGTGFSYVESPEFYVKNNRQISNDLMKCIREFFEKFPKFSKTPTFILAESYGGKMTVEFANLWYRVRVFFVKIFSIFFGIFMSFLYLSAGTS